MHRRNLLLSTLLVLAALVASGCGGGGSGFTLRTQVLHPSPFGPPTAVNQPFVGVAGQKIADQSGASGSQTSFNARSGSNSRLSLPNARVPARWAFASADPRCIGISPPLVNVSRGSTVSVLCLTGFAAAATMGSAPSTYSVDSPPATTTYTGYGIQTTNGQPFVEYYDPFTGVLAATVRATKVATNPSTGAQTVTVSTPPMSGSYFGSLAVVLRNAQPGNAPGDCVGTAKVAVSGGASYLSAPPPDPCSVGGCN